MSPPIEWLLIGGPEHGRWRLASDKPYAVRVPGPTDYATTYTGDEDKWEVRVAVATPPRPILYYPERVELPGWNVLITAYVEVGIAAGQARPAAGSVMPGCVLGIPREVEDVCRWCYGRPMDDMDVCSRTSCISNMASVQFLDVATGEDANWEGDRP
jgi:hypothetical protein